MSTNPTTIHPASVPPTTTTHTSTSTTTTPSSPTQQRLSSAQAAATNTFHTLADQANVLGEKAKSHPLVQEGVRGAEEGLNSLDRQLAKFGFLNDLEARTNIPKTYGVLGFGVTLGLLIILNLFGLAQPITNLIGWALPAYLSCQALESPQKGDDAQWLCYWIVFGTLNFLESAALRVILYYVPWYFTVKLFATLWLMLPQTRGAEQVYHAALRPLFQQGKQKAAQLQAPTPIPSSLHAHSHSTSTSTHTDSASPSLGYSSGVSTHASQLGGTGTNPFVSTSGGGSGLTGLHTTSAGSTSIGAGGYVPPAAGIPLPDTPGKL